MAIRNPYAAVTWATDRQLVTQLHCHSGIDQATQLPAYDAAGYHVMPLMTYSGDPDLPQSELRRLWPVAGLLSYAFVNGVSSIETWLPCAEEVGKQHMTSPFLCTYIEVDDAAEQTTDAQHAYSTSQECIDRIWQYNGIACLAHPWTNDAEALNLHSYHAMEIYSAHAECERDLGTAFFTASDRNADMLARWDMLLEMGHQVYGIAVNDHYGPHLDIGAHPHRDSGRTLIVAPTSSLADVRTAFEAGAFLAAKDLGSLPVISDISITGTSITIAQTGGTVHWISNGADKATGDTFDTATLAADEEYVRAEVHSAGTDRLYTQPFWLRPAPVRHTGTLGGGIHLVPHATVPGPGWSIPHK